MNIHIGNLSSEVNEEDLKKIFSMYGNVIGVKIIRDRYTGISKGFGFIELSGLTEAKTAISKLNAKELKGKSIVVNEARSKNSNGPGGRNQRNFKSYSNEYSGRW
jgi:RNA recognition motif-containing protein